MKYLTKKEGISGKIKVKCEDFIVKEILPFKPTNEGEHILFLVEKKAMSTFEVVEKIARELRISRDNMGYAGMKDKKSIAYQYFTAYGVSLEKIKNLKCVKVLEAWKHRKKLKIGKLWGNEFKIRIREVKKKDLDIATEILEILRKKGVPNYYEMQRFGIESKNHLIGEAIIKKDYEKVAKLSNNRFKERLPKHLKYFFISAFQSYLFNLALDERMPYIDKIFSGDIVRKGRKWFFADKDESLENFEKVATGPIFGRKMKVAKGRQGEIENKIIKKFNLKLEEMPKGARRDLRFEIINPKIYWDNGIILEFTLKKGCYATRVLREIMKD
jgi:tRNA pseudouridine13 synthase